MLGTPPKDTEPTRSNKVYHTYDVILIIMMMVWGGVGGDNNGWGGWGVVLLL